MASRRASKSLRCVRRRRRARMPRDGEEPLEDGEEEAEDCEEDAEDGDTAVGDTAEVGDTASCGGDDGGVDAQRCGQGRRGGTSSRGSSMLGKIAIWRENTVFNTTLGPRGMYSSHKT